MPETSIAWTVILHDATGKVLSTRRVVAGTPEEAAEHVRTGIILGEGQYLKALREPVQTSVNRSPVRTKPYPEE